MFLNWLPFVALLFELLPCSLVRVFFQNNYFVFFFFLIHFLWFHVCEHFSTYYFVCFFSSLIWYTHSCVSEWMSLNVFACLRVEEFYVVVESWTIIWLSRIAYTPSHTMTTLCISTLYRSTTRHEKIHTCMHTFTHSLTRIRSRWSTMGNEHRAYLLSLVDFSALSFPSCSLC